MITITINDRFEANKDLIIQMLEDNDYWLEYYLPYELEFDDIIELSVDYPDDNAYGGRIHASLRDILDEISGRTCRLPPVLDEEEDF